MKANTTMTYDRTYSRLNRPLSRRQRKSFRSSPAGYHASRRPVGSEHRAPWKYVVFQLIGGHRFPSSSRFDVDRGRWADSAASKVCIRRRSVKKRLINERGWLRNATLKTFLQIKLRTSPSQLSAPVSKKIYTRRLQRNSQYALHPQSNKCVFNRRLKRV